MHRQFYLNLRTVSNILSFFTVTETLVWRGTAKMCHWTPVLSDSKTPNPAFSGQWGQFSVHVGEAGFVEGWVSVNLYVRGKGALKLRIKHPVWGGNQRGICELQG